MISFKKSLKNDLKYLLILKKKVKVISLLFIIKNIINF